MRKNGINRELISIEGGVCAPQGFRACGKYIGILPPQYLSDGTPREDLALIVGDNRYPTACVYNRGGLCGAPIKVNKRHCSLGLARAVIVNSGIANIYGKDSEMQAETICRAVAAKLKTSADEILIASTGMVGEPFPFSLILDSVPALVEGLGSSKEYSAAAARAMMTTDRYVKEVSYSFFIGDYPCKIGAIFKGSAHVAPNMATTLCFLTTDVNISKEMLTRALRSAVNDTFNMLSVDGISSPNDAVCIMTSKKAENYLISSADTEYQKFEYALRETLFRICLQIANDGAYSNKAIVYQVRGARSKSSAKAIAKTLAGSIGFKKSLANGEISLSDVTCAFGAGEESMDVTRLQLSLSSKEKTIVLIEDGKRMLTKKESVELVLNGEELRLSIDFQDGNFSARAIGCDLAE